MVNHPNRSRRKAAPSAGRTKLCVLLEIDTGDPLLTQPDVSTAAAASAVRRSVLAALPRDISRVIAVLPVEVAQMLMQAHDAVAEMAGQPSQHPPTGWVPPGDRH